MEIWHSLPFLSSVLSCSVNSVWTERGYSVFSPLFSQIHFVCIRESTDLNREQAGG